MVKVDTLTGSEERNLSHTSLGRKQNQSSTMETLTLCLQWMGHVIHKS